MALQDDIMAMLSQIGAAGDRATSREALGRRLYAEMGDRLSGDVLRAALRDVESARGPMGGMEDYSRVADILEKYMADAAAEVPDDMIVDDTREAERMMETAGMAPREAVSIEELPAAAPRQAVTREPLPEVARPELDAAAEASLRREMGLTSIPSRTVGPLARAVAAETGTPTGTDLRDILSMVEEDVASDIRSGVTEASITAMLSALPTAALAARAAQAGIRVTETALSNPVVRQTVIRQIGTKMMRDPKTGRMLGRDAIGPQPQTPLNRMMSQAESGGVAPGMYAGGGNIRDKIMKTYGGM